jgi:hemolysin D
VTTVSQQAIARDRSADKTGNGAESDNSRAQAPGVLDAARVLLNRTQMMVQDRLVNLTPGMALTVEIKTGSRTRHRLPALAAAADKQSALGKR